MIPSVPSSFRIDVRSPIAERTLVDEYVTPERPVLLEGTMRGAPALGWTLDTLLAGGGARRVPVTFFDRANPYARARTTIRKVPVEEHVRALRSPRDEGDPFPYLICEIATFFPELLSDLERVPRLDAERSIAFELFVGRDSISTTHFHPGTHALLTQLRGEKIVILHPPEEGHLLYPLPLYDLHYAYSAARYDQPERYPDLFRARATVVKLRPGDTLFIPTRWWHTIYSLGESFSASYFWLARGVRAYVDRLAPRVHQAIWNRLYPAPE